MATGKDSRRINVTSIPKGIATEEIRAAWVGCTLPVVEEPPAEIKAVIEKVGNKFVVAKESAIRILREMDRFFAAGYWEIHCTSGFFFFDPQYCKEVQQS